MRHNFFLKRKLTQPIVSLLLTSTALHPIYSEATILKSNSPIKKEAPILLSADQLDYDQNNDTVIATGDVQIVQGDRLLRAQKVIYNKKADTLIATGDVWLKEPDSTQPSPLTAAPIHSKSIKPLNINLNSEAGIETPLVQNPFEADSFERSTETDEMPVNYTISFSPKAEFSDKFSNGFVKDVKMIMGDNARLAANSAKRVEGRRIILRQAVYSPCNVCRLNPNKMPLWQLKADKAIHSKEDQLIIYHHARLEMKGVPVFYLPYFQHADPTVKRKTGFLMPSIGAISDLGSIVSIPFYYVIAPNRDLTLVPIITTKQGPILVGEYRHLISNGEFVGSASYTQTKDLKNIAKTSGYPLKNRWHVFAKGRLELDQDHLVTLDVNKASDTTYLRRYPIAPRGFRLKAPYKNLTSTAAIEQFKDHSYAMLRASAYQTDNPSTTPYVLPHALYTYQSDAGNCLNDIWTVDADILSIGRRIDTPGKNARHMQRFSLAGGWRIPYSTPSGHLWSAQLALRGDAYTLERYQPNPNLSDLHNGFRGRLFPTASLQWRFPLLKRFKKTDWVVEPTAMLVGTTRVNNSSIPNEDSTNVQIEDTNLFLPQRFTGLDRVDTGSRAIYGATSTWHFPKQRLVQFFIGHSLRLDHRQVLPRSGGEDRRASDIVTRFRFHPSKHIQLLNRMAWHYKKTRPRISDTSAIMGKKILNLQINHTFVNWHSTINKIPISQATWALGTQPFEHWSFSIGETRNLKRNQFGVLAHTLSAVYHDECFRMTMSAFKSKSADRDIRPNSGLLIQFDFKNLGSINPLSVVGVNASNIL